MNRLILLVGGLVVVALFAALIGPQFVNWNDYRGAFEAEAGKILGHPVRVAGTASASILPSPSLTFTDVEVGDPEGAPLMTVKRFSATIELVPLLQGEIRVVSMTLDHPEVRLTLDDQGGTDWFRRSDASRALDPKKVSLEDVQVVDGRLVYADASHQIGRSIDGIRATIEAASLRGPWRVEGSFLEQGQRVLFRASSGIQLADGTIRVKTDFNPPIYPFSVSADGVVAITAEGPSYRGTYGISQVAVGAKGGTDPAGLRSDGSFVLKPGGLTIDAAAVAFGPADKSTSASATLALSFGDAASFSATAQARQLDIDRAAGGGPSEPVDVIRARDILLSGLAGLPALPIPGKLTFAVPAVVLGGSLVQDVSLSATVGKDGWSVDAFHARMPGQATMDVNGTITSGAGAGFKGSAKLAVAQPTAFATWVRGRAQDAGRLLQAFDLSGDVEFGAGRLVLNKATAKIGTAIISGSFWYDGAAPSGSRTLGTDLTADRIDFDAVKSVADLLLGGNWAGTNNLADTIEVRLAAGSLGYQEFAFRNVAVDTRYADDVLTVVRIAAGYDGGQFVVTGGRLENLKSTPRGRIDAKLEGTSLDVPTRFAQRLLPDSMLARWLDVAGPVLSPVNLGATVTAPAEAAGEGLQVKIQGTAGGTKVDVTGVTRKPSDWLNAGAELTATLESATSGGLIRQVGLAAATASKDLPGRVEINARGVPAAGLDTIVGATVAGVMTSAKGTVTVPPSLLPEFTGNVEVSAASLDLAVALAGMGIPGTPAGNPLKLTGDLQASATGAKLQWSNGTIAGDRVSGALTLAPGVDRGWRLDGSLDVDDVDLGWMMALGLGLPPVPGRDPGAPWPKSPFISPVYGGVSGKVAVTAGTLALSDQLGVRNARFDIALQPQRLDIDVTAGEIAGGTATGSIGVSNVGGSASVMGRFAVSKAALEQFVWRSDGRAVATGLLDLSANFEASGRTPAGLVASATGGGVLSINGGEARYINPSAAKVIIRASDLGQQYTPDALRLAFADAIGGSSLRFDKADGAFSIAAGTVRIKDLSLRGDGLDANASAVVDLSAMSIDSDWTVTFDPGDATVQGLNPRVGLLFRGPLASPARSIDAVPMAAYLNARGQARLLDVIALDDAARLERDRLTLLSRRINEDDTRRVADNREAARRQVAMVASFVALARLHDSREAASDKLWAAGLKAYADRASADATAAQRAADAARRAVDLQKPMLDAAQAVVTRALADEKAAAAIAETAAAELGAAQRVLDRANAGLADAQASAVPSVAGIANVAQGRALVAEAGRILPGRASADAAARIALVNAGIVRATAQAALDAATAEAQRLADASRKASLDAAAKSQAAIAAKQAVDKAAGGASRFDIGDVATTARAG